MPRLTKKAPKAAKKARMGEEMSKFKSGTLKSSSGAPVRKRSQAIAIGLNESGQSKKPPTDEQRGGFMARSTAAKKRRKRGIGRS